MFDGTVAIVTGATSGIGRAAALACGREGASVVVSGRRAIEGHETVARIVWDAQRRPRRSPRLSCGCPRIVRRS
jgi:NAD(P)-dependent dehydrogenase (short-subunit alcohol dehydrogenase family)